jgi:hypothetical protein
LTAPAFGNALEGDGRDARAQRRHQPVGGYESPATLWRQPEVRRPCGA